MLLPSLHLLNTSKKFFPSPEFATMVAES